MGLGRGVAHALTLNKFSLNLWLRRNTPALPLQISQAKQSESEGR